MFLNKTDIFKNKPNWKKQKFVTVVTKLWHCDEIRRFDGISWDNKEFVLEML
jgi:hypothetical protein